jgi:hypothetical protein
MKIREYLGGRSKYELLKDLERNSLDTPYLKIIRENSEVYYSFHDLFNQLKGSTGERVHLINEIIEYARYQVRHT